MKSSNSVEVDKKLWVPTQKNQRVADILQKSTSKECDSELWLPPLSEKEQKKVAHLRKTKVKDPKSRRRLNLRLNLKPLKAFKQKLERSASTSNHRLGFTGKLFWDWLPLWLRLLAALIIALSIFLGMSRFTSQQTLTLNKLVDQTTNQQAILAEQQVLEQEKLVKLLVKPQATIIMQLGGLVEQAHEQSLSNYLDRISGLLVSRSAPLLQSSPNSLERILAQARTNDILTSFSADPIRKGVIIQFLHDTGLISVNPNNTKGPIISLAKVNLSGLTLTLANLNSVDFDGVNLAGATLTSAVLSSSSMRGAILTGAKFTGADLTGADLSGASLSGADLTGAIMKGTNLGGADTKTAKIKGAIF